MSKKILKNEFLFHSVHGLCRVAAVKHAAPSTESSCSLTPVPQSRSRSRFTVPLDLLESSGFNRMISPKDALAILNYLKTGKKDKSAQGNAWNLAVTLRTESRSKEIIKDKRKGQQLSQLVRSLTNEMAIVMQSTYEEARIKIQENLAPDSDINPVILSALVNSNVI